MSGVCELPTLIQTPLIIPTRFDFRHFRTPALILLIAVPLLILAGCAKKAGDRTLPPQDQAWSRAMSLYHRGKWFRAQQLLKDFVLNYSGSNTVDSAQFYLGRCTFELDDYLTAAEEFKRVVSQYPYSKLAGDAAFWEARCYYEQSPSYQLDQTLTTQALDAFQRFLEESSGHALSDSGYHYISLCREKLSHKEYAAAGLYFDMHEYASAVLYCDGIRENYYDTPWAGPAQFLKARCFDKLGNRDRARSEYQEYIDKFPNGKNAEAARRAAAALAEYRSSKNSPNSSK